MDFRPAAAAQRALAKAIASGPRQSAQRRTLDALRRAGAARRPAAPAVIQRRMGMELEMKRKILGRDGLPVAAGDTKVVKHDDFKLVTDHFSGYSNLEFVMKHFDQHADTADNAVAELRRRLLSMHALYQHIYHSNRRLDAIPGAGVNPHDTYRLGRIGAGPTAYSAGEASVAAAPVDDLKLYVHYTVGFQPKHWKKMVQDVAGATRGDTDKARPKTHATNALGAIPGAEAAVGNPPLAGDAQLELQGHLALLYMQMMVFAERTLSEQRPELRRILTESRRKRKALADEYARVDAGPLGLLAKATKLDEIEQKWNRRKRLTRQHAAKLKSLDDQLVYGTGQVKNKIAALPRASLADMYGALSGPVQARLSAGGVADAVLDAFSTHLWTTLKLDLNEYFELESPAHIVASMRDYLLAGFGSGQQFTQQVLFGGMNEVGIDRGRMDRTLLPLEFRSLFNHYVDWNEVAVDAEKVLRWSRDPENVGL
jgi:hypothetical protein